MKKNLLYLFFIISFTFKSQNFNCFSNVAPHSFPVLDNGTKMCSSDFNKDGKIDFAVISQNKLTVLTNISTTDYSVTFTNPLAANPKVINTMDYNNDTYDDLVIGYTFNNQITIIRNNQNGTFSEVDTIFHYGSGTYALLSRDFNSDGFQDLIAVASGSLMSFSGSSSGTLALTYTTQGSNLENIISNDYNNDGNSDLVMIEAINKIKVLFGNGTGSFPTSASYTVASDVIDLTSSDLNQDGYVDIITCSYTSKSISVLMGTNSGTFIPSVNYTLTSVPQEIITGDFNNDSKADIGVTWPGTPNPNLKILLGVGTGILMPPQEYHYLGYSMLCADFDGDGNKDIAGLDNDINILYGFGNGIFPSSPFNPISNYNSIHAIDKFNNDLFFDMAVLSNGDSIKILSGQGNGYFNQISNAKLSYKAYNITSGDLNNDGNVDLAVTNFTPFLLSTLFGNGSGSFTSQNNYLASPGPGNNGGVTKSIIVDINNDNYKDIIILNHYSLNIHICINDGTGNFPTINSLACSNGLFDAVIEDFNNDGKKDIIAINRGNSTVAIYLGQGNGSFNAATNYSTGGSSPYSITSCDLNKDTKLDIAISNNVSKDISVLLGNGDGTFNSQPTYSFENNISSVVSQDFDYDGNPDLAVCHISNQYSILLGNGNGGLYRRVDFCTIDPSTRLDNYDLNNDGNKDIIASGNSIRVHLNNCAFFSGVEEINMSTEEILVYPNPSNDIFNIILTEEHAEIQIFNMNGQELMKSKLTIEQNKLNLKEVCSGIYILKATSKKGVFYKKLIKQ